jgi:hypothetical protein
MNDNEKDCIRSAQVKDGRVLAGSRTHPVLGQPDNHIKAGKDSQYATRHNPFVYFHSIIDHPTCMENVVPLSQLDDDLKSVTKTPNLAFITPNLCHDGHDRASDLVIGVI